MKTLSLEIRKLLISFLSFTSEACQPTSIKITLSIRNKRNINGNSKFSTAYIFHIEIEKKLN